MKDIFILGDQVMSCNNSIRATPRRNMSKITATDTERQQNTRITIDLIIVVIV